MPKFCPCRGPESHDAGVSLWAGCEDESVRDFSFRSMTVQPLGARGRRMKVAVDGEIFWSQPPLRFTIAPQPLMLMVPAQAAAPAQ